jgi:hypothetical protein
MLDPCAHPRSEIRRRIQSNGVVAYWRQCLTCGQTVGSALKHCDAPTDAKPFDEVARNRYWAEREREHRAYYENLREIERVERERKDSEWWQRYNRYLESDEWQRKRHLVLERDRNRCQARLDRCSIYATQVHHLSYKHVFNEPLFELVAICQNCHDTLHEVEDED